MGYAALIYALAALALSYPVLSGQFLVNLHSDQYIAGFAFRDFAAQALRAGQSIPQWNPYMFGGLPYIGAMHGDIFYPTALLRVLMRTDLAMTWGFILHLFAAGLFTFGFLRAWGLGFVPSLVGGLAYMLGGPVASYASPGHDGKLFVSALLPLALWLLIRGMRDGRAWSWGAFALTVGLALLSPHPQLLQYLLLTSGAFALYLAMGTDTRGVKLDRRVAVRRLAFALVAVLVGMAIGAIQYLPVREYVAWSPRAAGHDWATATSYSFPLLELFNLYLPQFSGILDRYWGENVIHLHSEYIGGSVLLLATLAFGGESRRGFRRFWIATGVVAMLWMLGGSTPFFRIIYELVPGTKFFRAPSTIIYVFSFSLSVLAALGTERVLARKVNPRVIYAWLGVGAFIAILGTGGMLSTLAENKARGIWETLAQQQGVDPRAYASRVQRATDNRGALLLGSWRSFLFLALAGGALLAWMRGKLAERAVAIALAVVVAVDLLSVAKQYWMFSPPAARIYASDPVIDFLKKEPQPGRVLVRQVSLQGVADRDPYFGNDGAGKGTGLMVHGIRSVTGYHGNELGRYQMMSNTPVSQDMVALMLPTFWRHENARYLYTNAALPDTQFKLLAGPVKNSSGSTVYLYRLPGDNPYAWVATAKAKAPDSDIVQAVLDPRFDPRRIAVYSDTSPLAITPPTVLPEPSPITTSTSGLTPGHATIALSAPAPANASLVVSENYFPGWTATVNGAQLPVYRADYNLIGIPLPEGAKTVELSFRDAAVEKGKLITLIAVLAALAALAGGVVVDRRRLA
jgi:hypothetical protein